VLRSQRARCLMTLATDTWSRCSAPAGIKSRFSSGTKHRRRSRLSSCRISTITTSIRLRGWSCRGVHPLRRELVSCRNLKMSKIQRFLFAEDCQYTCPELYACVNASIWCDGKVHCPSGSDESFIHCSRILRLPAEVLAVVCVLLLVSCFVCSFYIRR
jgi:hypothetical protein